MSQFASAADLSRVILAGEQWCAAHRQRGLEPQKVPPLASLMMEDNHDMVALTIGIDAYSHQLSLSNAVSDASAMATEFRKLKSTGVLDCYNSETKDDLLTCLEDQFCQWLSAQGQSLRGVFVFIAAHCTQTDSEIYVVPGSARLQRGEKSVPSDCLSLSYIVKAVTTAACGQCRLLPVTCCFIIDGCRNHVGIGGEIQVSVTEGYELPKGCEVAHLFSTSKGMTASDGAKDHSPYTAVLLEHLFSPEVTLSDVQTRVANAMGPAGAFTEIKISGAAGGFQLQRPAVVVRAPDILFESVQRVHRPLLRGVPTLPLGLTPRLDIIQSLEHRLLHDCQEVTAVTASACPAQGDTKMAVVGMGGIGKTTAVTMLCHESEAIRLQFVDGIVWLTVGMEFKPQDADRLQRELLSLLLQGEDQKLKDILLQIEPYDVTHEQKRQWDTHVARVEIGKLLSMRRCLVVLDDVWDPELTHRVLPRSSLGKSRVMITTRKRDLIDAEMVEVRVVDLKTSLEALLRPTCQTMDDLAPPQMDWASKLAKKCGGHLHTLALCAGMLKGSCDNLERVYRKLEKGLVQSKGRLSGYDHTVFGALQASLDDLADTDWGPVDWAQS